MPRRAAARAPPPCRRTRTALGYASGSGAQSAVVRLGLAPHVSARLGRLVDRVVPRGLHDRRRRAPRAQRARRARADGARDRPDARPRRRRSSFMEELTPQARELRPATWSSRASPHGGEPTYRPIADLAVEAVVTTPAAMQVRIEDVSPVEKKMFVEIPWETVSAKLGDAYKRARQGRRAQGIPQGQGAAPGARAGLRPARQRRGRVRARARVVLPREPGAQPRRGRRAARRGGRRRSRRASRSRSPRSSRCAARSCRRTTRASRSSAASSTSPETAVDEALAQLRREHTELRPIEGRDVTARRRHRRPVDHRHDRRAPDQPAAVRGRSRRRRARAAPRHARRADRHPARHQGQAARDRRSPRTHKDESITRPQGEPDRHDPRGAREGRARRSTTSSRRTPARPRRSTACKAALRKELEDKEQRGRSIARRARACCAS